MERTDANRRFRRLALIYLVTSLAGLVTAASVFGWTLQGSDPQLIAVYAVYWLLGFPGLRIILEWRRLRRKLLFAAIASIALFVSLCELVGFVRRPVLSLPQWWECAVASNRYHHVVLANQTIAAWERDGRKVLARINEDGFRSDYSRSSFRHHDLRVACLGDSFVFGVLLDVEEAIPAQMERAIRGRIAPRSAAVLNCSLVSYSPLLLRQLFVDRVVEYRPHVTVLCIDITDIGDDYRYAKENIGKEDDLQFPFPQEWTRRDRRPWEDPMTIQVLRASRLMDPFERLLSRLRGTDQDIAIAQTRYDYSQFRVRIGGRMEKDRYFVMRHPLRDTEPFFDRTYRSILRIRDDCEKTGSAFLLVLLPRNVHWNLKESPRDVAGWKLFTGHEPYKNVFLDYFEQRAQEDGIAVLNLLPVFSESGIYPLCFEDDVHYNAAGCRLAGGAIARRLESEGFLVEP